MFPITCNIRVESWRNRNRNKYSFRIAKIEPFTNNYQSPAAWQKPSKSFFNVLRKSKKGFEKAAMSNLRIIDQFI